MILSAIRMAVSAARRLPCAPGFLLYEQLRSQVRQLQKDRALGFVLSPCTSSGTQDASRKSRPSWTGLASAPDTESTSATVLARRVGTTPGHPLLASALTPRLSHPCDQAPDTR